MSDLILDTLLDQLKAVASDDMAEFVKAAYRCGFNAGYDHRQSEIRQALSGLGLSDMAVYGDA